MTTGRRIRVYRDKAGDWRWQLWESSDMVSESGEGYRSRSYAIERARAINGMAVPVSVSEQEDAET